MRRIVVVMALAGALAGALIGTAGIAIADPNLSNVAPHRHFIETENGLVEVGPRLCDNPELQSAFNQFHANTHTHDGVVGEIGPVAPGLHNGQGAELTFRGCAFTP
jgi:hypothetical protein